MKIAEIFFHFRLSILSETCVPSPQSNKNSSPSLRTSADVRKRPGSGIIPLVPREKTSRFTLLYYSSYSPFTRLSISLGSSLPRDIISDNAETITTITTMNAIELYGIIIENSFM